MRGSQNLPYPFRTHSMPQDGNLLVLYIVHADGDAEDRSEGDEVGTDVAVGNRAVVCTPVVHH